MLSGNPLLVIAEFRDVLRMSLANWDEQEVRSSLALLLARYEAHNEELDAVVETARLRHLIQQDLVLVASGDLPRVRRDRSRRRRDRREGELFDRYRGMPSAQQ